MKGIPLHVFDTILSYVDSDIDALRTSRLVSQTWLQRADILYFEHAKRLLWCGRYAIERYLLRIRDFKDVPLPKHIDMEYLRNRMWLYQNTCKVHKAVATEKRYKKAMKRNVPNLKRKIEQMEHAIADEEFGLGRRKSRAKRRLTNEQWSRQTLKKWYKQLGEVNDAKRDMNDITAYIDQWNKKRAIE